MNQLLIKTENSNPIFQAELYIIDKEEIVSLNTINISKLPDYIVPYLNIFLEEEANELPKHIKHDYTINLEEDKDPLYQSIYQLSPKEQEVLWDYIFVNLAKGWIRESKSPAGAPILFIPKKDGSLQLYIDYQGLNAIIIKNCYSLLLIGETIDQLASATIYT